MSKSAFLSHAILAFAGLIFSAAAHAQAFRTYLSSNGNDSNPCTLVAPCRLLPAGLAAVANGGEVWLLDSANYNTAPVSISKSVTILAVPGAVGSVLALGGNAINITTSDIKVALRNLVIAPFVGGGGQRGINVVAAASVTVENCLFANLPAGGIFVLGSTEIVVQDTTIRGGGATAIYLQNGARAVITRSNINGNQGYGVYVASGSFASTAEIINSVLSGNSSGGVFATGNNASGSVKVTVRGSHLSNADYGAVIQGSGGNAILSVADSTLVANNTGLAAFSGGLVIASRNTVTGNSVAGFRSSGGATFESTGDNVVRANGSNTIGTITATAGS